MRVTRFVGIVGFVLSALVARSASAAATLTIAPSTSTDGSYVVSWSATTVPIANIITRQVVYLAWTTDGVNWTKQSVTAPGSLAFTDQPNGNRSYRTEYWGEPIFALWGQSPTLRDTSNVATVAVQRPPGAFALSSPQDGATGIRWSATRGPRLVWTSAPLATSYDVSISSASAPPFTTTVTGTSLTIPAGVLSPGRTYTWHVVARNAFGTTAASSGPRTFTTQGRVAAAIDWTRPKRYGVLGPDGRVRPTNPYDAMGVVLDACGTTGFWPISSYTFTTSRAGSVPITQPFCQLTMSAFAGEAFTVTVTATDSSGDFSAASVPVTIVDRLVVAVGDSYASGEGNPDVPRSLVIGPPLTIVPAVWEDEACHRSHFSPGAYAAAALEDADPRSSVTFVSEACSFGTTTTVHDTQLPNVLARLAPPPGRAPRRVDLVSVGVGGNDLQFIPAMFYCLTGTLSDSQTAILQSSGQSCVNRYEIRHAIAAGKRDLPGRLDDLIFDIRQLPYVDGGTEIVLTEYPDPTRRPKSEVPSLIAQLAPGSAAAAGYCEMMNFNESPEVRISPEESQYLSSVFGTTLNEIVLSAAARNHVAFTAGVWDAATAHGYCAAAPWMNTYDVSLGKQGCGPCRPDLGLPCIDISYSIPFGPSIQACDSWGAIHPNEPGAQAIGDAIVRASGEPSGVAVYDATVGAPICAAVGSACRAGPDLLFGLGPAEPHAPNVIGTGTEGVMPTTSISALSVTTRDGGRLAPGARVVVRAEGVTMDANAQFALQHTARALEGGNVQPTWTTLATFPALASGFNTVEVELVLPEGALQAVRAFARGGVGAYDTDDLVFMTDGDDACPGSWMRCGGACVPHDDANNCGSCGAVCAADGICDDGSCRMRLPWE